MYILDKSNKVIHTASNLKGDCEIRAIGERADVTGLNWWNVENDPWLFCRHCCDEDTRGASLTEETEAEGGSRSPSRRKKRSD